MSRNFLTFWLCALGLALVPASSRAALDLVVEAGTAHSSLESGTSENLVFQAKVVGLGGPATLTSFSFVNPTLYGSPWDAREPEDIQDSSVTLYHAAAPATLFSGALPVAALNRGGNSDPDNRSWSVTGLSLELADDDRLFIAMGTSNPSPGVRAFQATVMAGGVTLGDGSSGPPADVPAAFYQFLRTDIPLTVAGAGVQNAGPKYVSGGDASVTLMELELSHTQTGAAGGELRDLVLTFKDGSGNPVAPDTLISELAVQDLFGSTYAVIADVAAAVVGPGRVQVPMDQVYVTGAYLPQGDSLVLYITASVVGVPAVGQFRAELSSGADIQVLDEWTGSQAAVILSPSPLQGSGVIVKPSADELILVLDSSASGAVAYRGESDLLLGRFILEHPSWAPSNVSDVEVSELKLEISDGSGGPVIPSSLFTRLSLENSNALYVEKTAAAIEASGSEILLSLFTPIRVQRTKPMTVDIRADIQALTLEGAFQVSVLQGASGSATITTKAQAQDANKATAVTVISAAAESFPVDSNVFQVRNAMSLSHGSLLEDRVFEGQQDVAIMRLAFTNPSASAGILLVNSLTFALDDGAGAGVVPSQVFDALRVQGMSGLAASDASPPTSGSTFSLAFATPVTVVFGTPVTLMLEGDLDENSTASSFRVSIVSASQVGAQHLTDPVPVGVVAALPSAFPMRTDVTALDSGSLDEISNYPNPFSAGAEGTRVVFLLKNASNVSAQIFTTTGESVRKLLQGSPLPAGPVEFLWDGRNGGGEVVRNGVYLLRVRVEDSSGSRDVIRKIGVAK